MALPYRKLDRHQILNEVTKMIHQSEEGEIEIASSVLADRFDVQAPTMDYHLNILVNEGSLVVSPKRGKYKRKIYRLPANAKIQEETVKQETPIEKPKVEIHDELTPESAEKFRKFLAEHSKKIKKEEDVQEELELEPKKELPGPESVPEPTLEPTPVVIEVPKEEVKVEPIVTAELTLDDRISKFLNEANQVYDANELLKHGDKEILSVMNETLQQTSVYLKDLSEQLSTIQNKQLITGLIDDRNRMHKQMERLEKEAEEARVQANQTIQKYEVEPNRVRFMHQMIVSTVDDFVNRPNQAMAVSRTDFRNKVSKEVSDLVKYVLHLEK